jgi:ABC-2 type transport system ATP-binding protein
VEELSKGMQQKVQFIVTILHEPKLLIFDEPFSGFDPINVNLLKKEILHLREEGASIIFSTHNMESVEELCDHFVLINRSEKILEGGVNEIKETYKQNIYEIEYEGDIAAFESKEHSFLQILDQDKDRKIMRLQSQGNISSNELLKELMNYISIVSFKENLPSMNDIFIQKVQDVE